MSATLSAILSFLGTVIAAGIAAFFVYRRAVRVDRPAQERQAEQVLIDKWRDYAGDLEKRIDKQDARLDALAKRVTELEAAERRAQAAEDYLRTVLAHFQAGGGWPPPARPTHD